MATAVLPSDIGSVAGGGVTWPVAAVTVGTGAAIVE
jgi:hypothetical protein